MAWRWARAVGRAVTWPVRKVAQAAGAGFVEGAGGAVTDQLQSGIPRPAVVPASPPHQETRPMVTNWKTTAAGLLAVVPVVVKIITSGPAALDSHDLSLIMAAIGLLVSKDKDVVGAGATAHRPNQPSV